MSATSTDPRFLEMFPTWLGSLGTDVAALGTIVAEDGPEPVRRYVVAGLNYLFKSLDLIPDGIDDLGFLRQVRTRTSSRGSGRTRAACATSSARTTYGSRAT
jgi:hypothetical protein